MSLLIRAATEQDVAALVAVENTDKNGWSRRAVVDELQAENNRLQLVVLRDDCLLGWCCAAVVAGEAELLKITIIPAMRRQGVGATLLKHLESYLKEKHVHAIFLEVRSQNVSAINFYLNFDYFQVGLRKKYYSFPKDDALVMKKPL